jgi:hypothetical protein
MRRRRALLAALFLGLVPGAAQGRPPPPAGSVIFVQKGALWRAKLAPYAKPPGKVKPDKPEKLLSLAPLRRRFTRLEAAGDGSALLLEFGRNAAWIDLDTTEPLAPVYVPCRGRARLSPSGERVLCASRSGKGLAVYRMRPRAGASILADADPAATRLADLIGERVLVIDGEALWSETVSHPDQRKQVSPHVPLSALSVAPDGERAVGRYKDESGVESMFGFRLDGQAVRRKLGFGVPISWSANSEWLAVAGDNTACAVRAVGGEFKCWDKFRALAIDHDGSWLLIAKPPGSKQRRLDLFLGRVGGPRAEKPFKLMRGVTAAVLIP